MPTPKSSPHGTILRPLVMALKISSACFFQRLVFFFPSWVNSSSSAVFSASLSDFHEVDWLYVQRGINLFLLTSSSVLFDQYSLSFWRIFSCAGSSTKAVRFRFASCAFPLIELSKSQSSSFPICVQQVSRILWATSRFQVMSSTALVGICGRLSQRILSSSKPSS